MADQNLVSHLFQVSKEDLSPGVRDTLPKVSRLFERIHNEWEGVVSNPLGRPAYNASSSSPYASTWVYRWIWTASGGGAFRFTNPSPNLVTDLGSGTTVSKNQQVWKSNRGFPSTSQFVIPKYANPFVGLKQGRGILAMPWQLLRANSVNGVVVDVMANQVKQSAKITAFSEAVSYLSRNPSWGECIRSSLWTPTGSTANHPAVTRTNLAGTADTARVTFKTSGNTKGLWDESTINMLTPGLSVDIIELWWDVSDTSSELQVKYLDAAGFVVSEIDYLNQAVSFVTLDGSATGVTPVASGLATGDRVMYLVTLRECLQLNSATSESAYDLDMDAPSDTSDAGFMAAFDTTLQATITAGTSVAYGPDGLSSWMKTSYSDTLYGITLADMPNLLSLDAGYVNDYLTEPKLNAWIGWYMKQYGEDKLFDTILLTDGVLNGFVKNLTSAGTSSASDFSRFVYDRQGKNLDVTTGWDDFVVRYRGKRFTILDDPMAPRQTLYGLKTRDKNYKRLMPPPLQGATGKSEFRDVEFIAPLGGLKGPYMWDVDGGASSGTNAMTDYIVAPYVVEYQHFVQDPQAFRARGLLEDTGV